ncbi:unnamed protein product [Nezara viridula]|uniref:SCP domain-containing protein n=1 Tax=Nezara viridula TaxID=85310 RepID=A0A9P0MYR4_NEZVI|nr:unnamed protein product [Nezara viridula]
MIYLIFQLLLLIRIFRPSEQSCRLNEKKSKLTCADINLILDYHNECRDQVAGGKTKLEQARDMWVLKWDSELAEVAQDHANKCILEHNARRPMDTGENIAWMASSENSMAWLKSLTHMWYKEIQDYNQHGSSNIDKAGHFTQMIWADTKYVGCGLAFYDNVNDHHTPYQTLLVCNYRPPP